MPKIEAGSVAEHRELRRGALVGAARDVLLADGLSGLSFAAVAERAGMARNSVYDYFPSRDDLILAVCEDEFRSWAEDVNAALAGCRDPKLKVRRYVDVQLEFVISGRHRLASLIGGVALEVEASRRMGELHRQLLAPLHEALGEAGVPDPSLRAALLQGVVNAATTELEAGVPPSAVKRQVRAFIDDGLW